jgi:tetratricopeptide (TPR) repeat protein
MSNRVFICYSRTDSQFVDRLVSDIRAAGISTWRDIDDIADNVIANTSGWDLSIQSALSECTQMLAVLSPASLNSKTSRAEWNYFVHNSKPIYPVICRSIPPVEMPFRLLVLHYFDLRQDYESQVQKLIATLQRNALSKRTDPSLCDISQTALDAFNRGSSCNKRGEPHAAIANYTQVIGLCPQYAQAYHNRGNIYEDLGEYDKAIADYTEAIRIQPQYGQTYLNRGNIYDELGEYDKAIADYTEAIRLRPNYAYAYNNRGNIYKKQREYAKAISDYTAAICLSPIEFRFYQNRSLAYREYGDLARAEADANAAAEKRSANQQ